MRKFSLIMIVVLTLATCIPALSFMSGCIDNGEMLLQCSDPNFGKYDGKVIEDMSAFDLVMEAYANFCENDNYTREEYFTFNSRVATRNSYLISKIVGDKLYNQEIIVGTGFDTGTCAKRFYSDSQAAFYINNTTKAMISYNKTTKVFAVKDWGDFIPYEDNPTQKIDELRYKITTYDIYSRDILSDTHDDNVYEKNGVYYCQIKINCSTEMMDSVQIEARNEFLDMLSARQEGFVIEDTTLDFAIEQINGKYLFTIWKRTEKYSGKHTTGIKVSCRQECISYYTYGGASITADDLLNLA